MISARPSFGPVSELERPDPRLGPWRTLRTCDRKTHHLVLNPREGIGSHARWTARGTPPRAPQVLQQPVLLQFDKRCGWKPVNSGANGPRGACGRRWGSRNARNVASLPGATGSPVKGLSSCGQFAHLNQFVCAFCFDVQRGRVVLVCDVAPRPAPQPLRCHG